MNVLITGITGFVGSHLADYILEHHPDVVVHGTKRWRSPLANIEHIIDRVHLHDCELRDLGSLIRCMSACQPDLIFHLAAQTYVPYSYIAPADTLTTNVVGTANLLEAVRLGAITPLVHICSSSEVYGQVQAQDIPIREDCPLRPVSPYGVSKVAEDMLGWQYHVAHGLKTVRTRMFTHTGPRRGDMFVTSNFAKQIALIEAGRQSATIKVGNLDSVRTFADVRDTVRAYWVMMEALTDRNIPAGDVFNIGGDRSMTVGEALHYLLSLSPMGERVSIEVDPARLRPADVTLQIPSVEKFKAATGWVAEIPFETTMQDLLDYWRQQVATPLGSRA